MDVRLPDGTIVTNVPEGITQADLIARIGKPPPTTAESIAAHPATRLALGAASLPLGIAQLMSRNPVSKALGQDKYLDETLARVEEMKKAGGHEGIDWMGLLGAVGTPMGALSKIPLAATRGQRIGQGIAIGSGVGAGTPVTENTEDFGTEKAKQMGIGAAVGPVLPALVSGGAKAVEMARNVVDPLLPGGIDRLIARTANKAAGAKRPEVMQALEQNRQIVPGSQAAAGEVAAPAGSAEFSALQRVVEPLKPTAYRDIAKAQDQARVAAVRTVGQDKATLEAAETARSANAALNYGKAYQQAVKADPALAQISKNPYFQDALPDAIKLAEAAGVNSKTDLTRFLQYVKVSLDKAVSKTGDSALSNSERQAVQVLRGRLINWMGKKNPAYEAARAEFAAASKPINQMEVGQYLEGKLVPALNDSDASANLRGTLYAGALRDAPGTLKRATGFNRYGDISDVLNPQQTQTVRAVGQDLARKSEYEDLAQKGAAAARDLTSQPKMMASGMLNPNYSVIRAVVNRLQDKISGKALEALAVKMQDPKEMARVMGQLNPQDRKAVIEEVLQHMGRAATVGATTGLAQ